MENRIRLLILITIISFESLIVFSLLSNFSIFKLTGNVIEGINKLNSTSTYDNENVPNLPPFTPFYKKSSDPLLHSELIPNHFQYFYGFSTWLNTTIIKINSDGMRDVEYTIQKPPNTVRIAVLGDSFTFGWGVNLSQSYPKVLEKELNDMNSTINYQVMNFGVPGYNTLEEVELFKNKAMKYNPDVVIVGYVAGDPQNNSKIEEYINLVNENISWVNGSQRQKEVLATSIVYDLLNKDMVKNFQQNMNGIVLGPLTELGELSVQRGFKVVIVYLRDISAEEINEIDKVAKEYNFCVINTGPTLDNYSLNSRYLSPYDQHPNPFEHKLIADIIFNGLISQNCLPA